MTSPEYKDLFSVNSKARSVRLPERKWREVGSKSFDNSATRIKVVTYNILAHQYTLGHHAHRYDYDLRMAQDWHYRAERVMMEIENDMPDVLCLQEVDHFEEFYRHRLEALGFKHEMVYRRGIDAQVIAYRDQFYIVDKQRIQYNDLIWKDEDYGQEIARTFRKGNVAIIVALEHESGKRIVVASTHLTWDPNFDYVKYAQAAWLQQNLS